VFLLTSFNSPSLTGLERGSNKKKLFVSPFSFSKERGRGWVAWGMRRAAVSEANRRHCLAFVSRHCDERSPKHHARHCEPLFIKGEAISYWMRGNSFWDCFTHCVHSQWRVLHFVRNDDKARIAEAKAKPVAARPEHTTATCHCEDRSAETISDSS